MRRYRALAAVLLLQAIGAGGVLLITSRTWQTITADRPAPFSDAVADASGRDLDPASLALGLVALAGVVAVLATKGVWRRVVGGVVALAGAGLVWRGIESTGSVGAARARSLVESKNRTVSVPDSVSPDVVVHTVWPALVVVCGVVVLLAGVAIAVRGGRWQSMSSRYERAESQPPPDDDDGSRAAASMWSALDRGDDPTDTSGDPDRS
ncbi:Trp biosynthesis-associated membrane protein [Jatrophihabitans fulvus]